MNKNVERLTFDELYDLYQEGLYNSLYDPEGPCFIEERFQKENLWHAWFVLHYGEDLVEEAYRIINDMRYVPEILWTMRIYYNIVCNDGIWIMVAAEDTVTISLDNYHIVYKSRDGVYRHNSTDKVSNMKRIFDYFVYRDYRVLDMTKRFKIKTCRFYFYFFFVKKNYILWCLGRLSRRDPCGAKTFTDKEGPQGRYRQ